MRRSFEKLEETSGVIAIRVSRQIHLTVAGSITPLSVPTKSRSGGLQTRVDDHGLACVQDERIDRKESDTGDFKVIVQEPLTCSFNR